MKNHNELRQMAADLAFRKLKEDGRNVVMAQKRDPASPTPLRTIPVILDQADVDEYEADKARYPGEQIPSPIPIMNFSAWTYKARCPKCTTANVDVSLPDDMSEVDAVRAAPASCLRPMIQDKKRDCGWSGVNEELLRQCFTCGEFEPNVEDGICPECSKPVGKKTTDKKPKARKVTRKKASLKKVARKKTSTRRKRERKSS